MQYLQEAGDQPVDASAPEEKKPENPADKIAAQAEKASAAQGGAAASDSVAGTDRAGSAGTAHAEGDEHALDEQHEDTRPHGATLASAAHAEPEEPSGPFIVELATPSQLRAMTDAGIVFERFAPSGVVQPPANDSGEERATPLEGTAAGEIVASARRHLVDFEAQLAAGAHHLATEAYDLFRDKVDELRGHFHRRSEP